MIQQRGGLLQEKSDKVFLDHLADAIQEDDDAKEQMYPNQLDKNVPTDPQAMLLQLMKQVQLLQQMMEEQAKLGKKKQ